MIPMTVRECGNLDFVNKAIQHTRDAITRIEKYAAGFMKYPCGNQWVREHRNFRGVQINSPWSLTAGGLKTLRSSEGARPEIE